VPSNQAGDEIAEAATDTLSPTEASTQLVSDAPAETDRAVANDQPEAELTQREAATESGPGDKTETPSIVDRGPSPVTNERGAVVSGEPVAALGDRLASRASEVVPPIPATEAISTETTTPETAAADAPQETQVGSEAPVVAGTTTAALGDPAAGSGPVPVADASGDPAAVPTTTAALPPTSPTAEAVAFAPAPSETGSVGSTQPGNPSANGATIDAVSAAVRADQLTPRVEASGTPTTSQTNAALGDNEADELWAQVQRALHRVRTGLEGAELRLRLHPAELGELLVQVRTQGDQLSVRLVTSSTAAQQTLLADQQRLAAELAEAGFADGMVDIGQWGAGNSGGDRPPDHDERTSSDPSTTRSTTTPGTAAEAELARIDPNRPGRRRAGLVDLTL
jgi:flagellar hook-length control protein FliK